MLLTRNEFLAATQNEVRVLLHLATRIRPADLEYRPSAGQRSVLELLQYLTIMGPQHARFIQSGNFDMESWRGSWTSAAAEAKMRDFEATREALAALPGTYAAIVDALSEEDLRAEVGMFGRRASRGSLLVNLVLSHHAAYRMQLFLYLKACGHPELNTLNLWAGRDAT